MRISDWSSDCALPIYAREKVTSGPLLAPVLTAIETVEKQKDRILQRWASTYSNARMEALNGIFKAARARARGYRNTNTFISMIYLIAAQLGDILKSKIGRAACRERVGQ